MGYKSGQNIGIRLMLLRDYLNAHAGKLQTVKREELHACMESKGFPVEVSLPFYAWIATFGRGAKILDHAPVVDGMKQFLQKAAEMYKEAEDT